MSDPVLPPPKDCSGDLSAARPAKILAVDANEDILNIIQRILAKQGYQISTASNGREALEVARREIPDVILLDVMLPEVDGLTVCRQLKADPTTRGTMIILVTGRGSIDHRAEGLDAGADDYIPKPFHITELLARVRSSLRIKRLTDELRERNRELVESQRERLRSEKMATIGLLATGIAHEFNNIMSGISGYAQLARRNPKFRDQLIDVALIQSERAQELTRSFSTFYRPSPDLVPIHLAEVVENALCLVAKKIEDSRISLVKRIGRVREVLGSAGQLQEVVLNLIINSIQAIGSDGKIEISLEESGSSVLLSVQDNGCGIPPENLDRIFDPFFTTKGVLGGGSEGGSGLGLSVSYNIIRAHGGRIDVRSAPGPGTAFTVVLPAIQESGLPAAAPEAKAAGAPAPKEPRDRPLSAPEFLEEAPREASCDSLLLADPEEAIQEMVTQFAGARETVCAAGWSQALDLFRKRPFSCIILDMDLPGRPGLAEALDALREIHPEAQIVVTSRRYPESADQQVLARARGHLLKPYTVENLAVILAHTPVETM